MEKIRGAWIVLNGVPMAVTEYKPVAVSAILYEIIRIINGHAIFRDDHLERLENSCRHSGHHCPSRNVLTEQINILLENSEIATGNIKLILYDTDGEVNTAVYFIPHFYPQEKDYRTGVHTKTYRFIRPDPTIKRWNERFREGVGSFIQKENLYEAILINEQNILTEGSRSNVFFIDENDRILTAPESLILPGITRKYIIRICKKEKFPLYEKTISVSQLNEMKACFLSGTSPKVLPVRTIDNVKFEVDHPVVNRIMNSYESMIIDHLQI